MLLFLDTDATPAPPSYTAEATVNPWVLHDYLPSDSEVAYGVGLDSIHKLEDAACSDSQEYRRIFSSSTPLVHEEGIPEAPPPAFRDSGESRNQTVF